MSCKLCQSEYHSAFSCPTKPRPPLARSAMKPANKPMNKIGRVGKATAAAAESLARNPAARPGIQLALILGLALIESLALYTLVIIFAKVK